MSSPSPWQFLLEEIVREIYFHVASQELPYQPRPASELIEIGRLTPGEEIAAFNLGWMRLLHVNHQFRVVGLEETYLWARNVCTFTSEDAVETILQRAGDFRPLSVNICDETFNARRCQIATNVLGRISSLKCSSVFTERDTWSWASTLSGQSLPLLRELGMCIYNSVDAALPPLVAGALEKCWLYFDLPLVAPNLREMTYDGAIVMDLRRLTTHLVGFPGLTYLYLGNVPTLATPENLPEHLVQLPSLRFLGCGGTSFENETAFFRCLDLPSTTTIRLTTGDDDEGDGREETLDACRALLRSMLPQLLHPQRTWLCSQGSERDHARISHLLHTTGSSSVNLNLSL